MVVEEEVRGAWSIKRIQHVITGLRMEEGTCKECDQLLGAGTGLWQKSGKKKKRNLNPNPITTRIWIWPTTWMNLQVSGFFPQILQLRALHRKIWFSTYKTLNWDCSVFWLAELCGNKQIKQVCSWHKPPSSWQSVMAAIWNSLGRKGITTINKGSSRIP